MLVQYKTTLYFILLMATFIFYNWYVHTDSPNQFAENLSSKLAPLFNEKENSPPNNRMTKDAVFLSAIQKVNTKLNELSTTIVGIKIDIDSLKVTKAEDNYESNNETVASESSENQFQSKEQLYEDRFLSEQDDPSWSVKVENQTLDAFALVSDTLTAVELNCRSSLCKLNMSRSNDMVGSDEVLEAFESSVNWKGEMYINYNLETGEGTAYLARPGSTLNVENMENQG